MSHFYLELIPLVPDVCWNGFPQVVTCTTGFIHVIQKKWSCDDEFHDRVMSESLSSGSCFTVCLQVCWVSHFLARYNPRYATANSWTDAKSIAWRRFALNSILWRNLQQMSCKLWPSTPRDVCHHMTTYFESRGWNQQWVKRPEKMYLPFSHNSKPVITVCSSYFCSMTFSWYAVNFKNPLITHVEFIIIDKFVKCYLQS